MKRIIDHFLLDWKKRPHRKPLLLRGARQVGKTHAARVLGQTFKHFVEVNLESNEAARLLIEKDMDPRRIIQQLSELLQTQIDAGTTLLFFDEIQASPKAILTLRYFYEQMPELHIIAAGSLLDFAIEEVGMPVGRVTSLFMFPLSFLEFLAAAGKQSWVKNITERDSTHEANEPVHNQLLDLLGEYIAVGGMPEAVKVWCQSKASRDVKIIHSDLLFNYQQDFGKYGKKHQIKYLNLLFNKLTEQIGQKFVYNRVGEFQKRELEPALELLEKAGLIHKICQTSGQGIPLGAQADLSDFKPLFLDLGLTQALLKLDLTAWLLNPSTELINKGNIIEAFVGQELLAYSDPVQRENLFYWRRDARGSQAEVDYLIQLRDQIVPIEVKAGSSRRIQSMQLFLESHTRSSYGIRFWAKHYDSAKSLRSFPLYAVGKPLLDADENLKNALLGLL